MLVHRGIGPFLIFVLALAASCEHAQRDTAVDGSQHVVAEQRYVLRMPDEDFDALLDADWVDDSTVVAVAGTGTAMALATLNGSSRKVGRRGQGPGEFMGLVSVSTDPNGTIQAVDTRNRRLSRWTADGRLIGSVPFTGQPTGGVWQTDVGLAVAQWGSGTQAAELLIYRGQSMGLSSDTPLVKRAAYLCTVCNMSVAPNGEAAVPANETSYVVNRYDAASHALAPVVRFNVPLVNLTQTEIDSAATFRASKTEQMRGSGLGDSAIVNLLRNFKGTTIRGRFVPRGVHHDANSNLWLQRNVPRGAVAEADVFDAEARLMATVTLPVGFTIFRINDKWILGQALLADGGVSLLVLHNPLIQQAAGRISADGRRRAVP